MLSPSKEYELKKHKMEDDIHHASEESKRYVPVNYQGNLFTLSNTWLSIIPLSQHPMKILTIGTGHGANLCSLLRTYAAPDQSVIHCVDPWLDNGDYHTVIQNLSTLSPPHLHKIYLYRCPSEQSDQVLPFGSYDLIYIDGNHPMKNILEDLVLSMKRIKKEGWIIIGHLSCPDVLAVVERALPLYEKMIALIQSQSNQLFIQIKSSL